MLSLDNKEPKTYFSCVVLIPIALGMIKAVFSRVIFITLATDISICENDSLHYIYTCTSIGLDLISLRDFFNKHQLVCTYFLENLGLHEFWQYLIQEYSNIPVTWISRFTWPSARSARSLPIS